MKQQLFTARKITVLAILLALVIVLQVFASSIKIGPIEFSLTLVPIVLGAMILGPLYGAILGFTFGLITLIAGITGASEFTAILFNDHPFLTSLTCIVKGTAAGLVSGFIYSLIAKKHKYAATFVASASAPIVNTGLFVLGALTMYDTISGLAGNSGVMYFLIIGCAGWNFVVEFALNMILAPAIYRVSEIVTKKKF